MQLRVYFVITLLKILATGQTCYWPNGVPNDVVKPCPVTAGTEAAACCFEDHYCLTNGLCFEPLTLTMYRGACTDETFQSSGCPKYCDKSDIPGSDNSLHIGVWTCGNARFSCSNLQNCATGNFTAASTDLGDMAAFTSTAGNSSGTCSMGNDTDSKGSISAGAAAGIGVGVGVPLAIAAGVLAVMLLREKKKTATTSQASEMVENDGSKASGPSIQPVWVHAHTGPPELSNQQDVRHELPQ
ncbi:hypothetical protein BDP55DRAFT_709124 [Colletotrichum godetiae]|uniref:Uncharacterized protein n=1 Tax=Colletotrichum godetiae TaxID=1209918 RepID=A0AAJ0A5C8_9PEZI|nr:uncharacterized protein BDP55DRAFT_709124 [Colletotrichum godetiae]KAK1656787.1 hypothetical protein BDP55DRAFT_709124 [Colletotrichum godetiae]